LVGALVKEPEITNTEEPVTEEQIAEWDSKIRAARNHYLIEVRDLKKRSTCK
jgi:hypothetical protein